MNTPNSKIALGIKAAAIVLAALLIYIQDLTIVANEALRSELMSHILAVPFLFAYLTYRKRRMLMATVPLESSTTARKALYETIGAILCLSALLLYWYGSHTFNPLEYHMVSLPIFVAGLIITVFNLETLRVLAFPVAFLLSMVPIPLEFVHLAATTLTTASSETAYAILKASGLPVTLSSQYGVPIIMLTGPGTTPVTFAVDIACSDLYELTGFTVFAIFVAYIARATLPKKTIIFIAGFPLIYALNIARIVGVIILANQQGMQTAMQIFHLLGGWTLIFIGTTIFLTISEKILKIQLFTKKTNPPPCTYCNPNPGNKETFCPACGKTPNPPTANLTKRDIAKIAVIALAAVFIANLQVPVFALTEGPAEINTQTLGGEQPPTQILPQIPQYETKFIYRDKRFEEIAKQDASLIYGYTPTETTTTKAWVAIEIAKTRSSLHRWEVCLITWPQTHGQQPKVTQTTLKDIQILDNPPVTARLFAFQDRSSGTTQIVLYWFENAYFNTGQNIEKEHVKMSLIAFANNPEDIPQIEQQLLSLAKPIVTYWQPIKTWSQINLLLSQNGTTLLTATIATLTAITTYKIIQDTTEKRSNKEIYQNLAIKVEKRIIQAVQETQKETATGTKIAQKYQELTRRTIGLETLAKKLEEAKEAGLIRQVIANVQDEPILTWKTHI